MSEKIEPGYYWARYKTDDPVPPRPEIVEVDERRAVVMFGREVPFELHEFEILMPVPKGPLEPLTATQATMIQRERESLMWPRERHHVERAAADIANAIARVQGSANGPVRMLPETLMKVCREVARSVVALVWQDQETIGREYHDRVMKEQRRRWRSDDALRTIDSLRIDIAGVKPGAAMQLAELQSRLVDAEHRLAERGEEL